MMSSDDFSIAIIVILLSVLLVTVVVLSLVHLILLDLAAFERTHTRLTALVWATRVSWYHKGKTNLDFTVKQETVSGSGISWAICKSAPRSRQITTPPCSFFTGRMPSLLSNQRRQSTEGTTWERT